MLISGARRAFSCSADERTNQIKDERLGSVSTYVRTCRIRRRCGWCICRADRCAAGGSMRRKHMASRTALLLLSTADTGTSAFMAPAFLCGGCTRDTYYTRVRAGATPGLPRPSRPGCPGTPLDHPRVVRRAVLHHPPFLGRASSALWPPAR
jgi:hypothetical protein